MGVRLGVTCVTCLERSVAAVGLIGRVGGGGVGTCGAIGKEGDWAVGAVSTRVADGTRRAARRAAQLRHL